MKLLFFTFFLLSINLSEAQITIEQIKFKFDILNHGGDKRQNEWEFKSNKNDFTEIKSSILKQQFPNFSFYKVKLWKNYCKYSKASNFIVIYISDSLKFEIFNPLIVDDSFRNLFNKFLGKKLNSSLEIANLKNLFSEILKLLNEYCKINISESETGIDIEILYPTDTQPTLKRIKILIGSLTITDITYT